MLYCSPVWATRQGGGRDGGFQRGRGVDDLRVLPSSQNLSDGFIRFQSIISQAPHLYDVVRQLWPVLGPYSLLGVIILYIILKNTGHSSTSF